MRISDDSNLLQLASELAAQSDSVREERLSHYSAEQARVLRALIETFTHETVAGAADDGDHEPAKTPEKIGPFTLLRLLGEGGMGSVYLAQQERPRRLVALKLIRSGNYSPSLIERFRREAEFLGDLEHPGIARIFAAGEHPGPHGIIPYLAMEYVEGASLREHSQGAGLDDRARLKLVAKVARAVHHAHVRGVVHRDLKPGNILVGADGEPRVLDFGIALRLGDTNQAHDAVGDPQRLTQFGELVGTLSYMGPEQINGDARRVDQRSDVYALGVILYELLSGEHPHTLRNSSLIEAARIVSEQPARSLAKRRPELAGDVDTIVMKALEPDRDRRYQSANEFAEDIERLLDNRPILARPATSAYIASKFLRRHRLAASAAAITLLSLIAAVAVSLHFAYAEAQARREAVTRAETNAAVSRFLVDMLTSADPERALGDKLTLRQALDAAAESASATMSDQPAVQAQVKGTLATTYRSLGDVVVAEALYEQALALLTETTSEDAVGLRLGRIGAVLDAGRFDESLADAELLLTDISGRSADDPQRLMIMLEKGRALLSLGKNPEAREAFREVVTISDSNSALNPEIGLQARHNLASALRTSSEFAEAETLLREILARRREVYGNEHPLTLYSRNNLAAIIQLQGRDDEAEAEFRSVLEARRRMLGPEHLSTLTTMQNLGNLLAQQGRRDEAEPLIRAAAEVTERVFGPEHARTQTAQNSLAYLLEDLGQLDEAEALHRSILARQNARLAAGETIDSELLGTRNNLAMLLARKGEFTEAISQFDVLMQAALAALPDDHAYVAIFRSNYGDTLTKAGQPQLARPLLEAAFPVLESGMGVAHKRTRDAAKRLAETYNALDMKSEAARYAAIATG